MAFLRFLSAVLAISLVFSCGPNETMSITVVDNLETDTYISSKDDTNHSQDGFLLLKKDATEETRGIVKLPTEEREKVLDDISFNATDKTGETITIDNKYVNENLGNLVKDTDLSKFIL